MSRPILLIPKYLLETLADKFEQGIPISRLKRDYELDISNPTLTKLIDFVLLYRSTDSEEVSQLIYESLYPKWLHNHLEASSTEVIFKQPSHMTYTGQFPLGEWIEKKSNLLNQKGD